jgi:hypothetical protein
MKASAVALLLLGLLSPFSQAQDKAKVEDKPKAEVVATTPVKVQIVFIEFENEKKVKSLPYTMYMNAPDAPEVRIPWVKMRVGSRVPVYTGGGGSTGNMTYLDVGTNIDALAAHTPEGHFLLRLNLERSWAEGHTLIPVQRPEQMDPNAGSFQEPIIGSFRSEVDLKLREGQTLESTMATDPISGKVMKVEVSLSVVK